MVSLITRSFKRLKTPPNLSSVQLSLSTVHSDVSKYGFITCLLDTLFTKLSNDSNYFSRSVTLIWMVGFAQRSYLMSWCPKHIHPWVRSIHLCGAAIVIFQNVTCLKPINSFPLLSRWWNSFKTELEFLVMHGEAPRSLQASLVLPIHIELLPGPRFTLCPL